MLVTDSFHIFIKKQNSGERICEKCLQKLKVKKHNINLKYMDFIFTQVLVHPVANKSS